MESESEPILLPIQSTERHDTTATIIGKTKTFAGLEVIEWAFLAVSFVNILTCIGCTLYRLIIVLKHDPDSPDFTFTLLILLNTGFCLFYVIYGVLREKEFEVYAYIAAAVSILVYCILEYSINIDGRSTVKLIRLVAGSCMVPINVVLGVFVARRFGWLEFKIVGASEAMQLMYKEAARFTSLLKFDFQATLTALVLILQNGTDVNSSQVIIVSLGAVFCLLWCLIGWTSMRKEWKSLSAVFAVVGLVGPAFAIYQVVSHWNTWLQKNQDHKTMVYATLAAGAVYLTVTAVLYFELYRVCRNYNQGLRERAFEVDERTSLLSLTSKR